MTPVWFQYVTRFGIRYWSQTVPKFNKDKYTGKHVQQDMQPD